MLSYLRNLSCNLGLHDSGGPFFQSFFWQCIQVTEDLEQQSGFPHQNPLCDEQRLAYVQLASCKVFVVVHFIVNPL